MLPMPEYTHPDSPMNMVSHLKQNDIQPDLGPKTYVATGRCCLPHASAALRQWQS